VKVVLALDQGTTSSRAIVFDVHGHALSMAQSEFAQYFPQPGWVEHDPEEIWQTQFHTAQQALRDAGVLPRDVAAIGIANQRETTVLWDRATGRPLHNAIVWQDRRTAAQCEALRERRLGDLVRDRTGLTLDPYFSATKLAWLLDRYDPSRERASRGDLAFGTIDTWLIWKLSGGKQHLTDVTNASRTMLFDIARQEWSDELLRAFGVPRTVLPDTLPCTADFGRTAVFGGSIRIAGVAGDQQAALMGQAAFDPGLAKNTYGTGSFVVLNTGDRIVRSEHGLLSTIAFSFERRRAVYALEGSVFVTGAAIQWLRDGLGLLESAAQAEELARSVPDNGGVYFVPAFTGMGAPYWDPYARATIAGMTRGTTRAHIVRAALEAMGFQCAEVIAAMREDAGLTLQELRVDGGASRNGVAMQFQADILGTPVVRPTEIETTALGAAYLAGLQAGVWKSLDEVRSQWRPDGRFVPAMPQPERERHLARWHQAVECARGWARGMP
jgi:glycerol kinase